MRSEQPDYSPARVFDVTRYGAKGDGKTKSTDAIQRAVDGCFEAGGGTVYLPPGKHLSGPITLKSNVTLYLDAGATLLGSELLEDYGNVRHLVFASEASNIAIAGEGTIDGSGQVFWPTPQRRPGGAVELVACKMVRIRDVTIQNSPSWSLHVYGCENVSIRGVSISNDFSGPNTDGIDVTSCSDVTISDCRISTGDDAIVLKNLTRGHGPETKRSCRNITVTNCVISSHCNGFKIGTESERDFENITFSNSVVFMNDPKQPDEPRVRGIAGVAVEMVDGANLSNVVVSNIVVKNFHAAVFIRLGNRGRNQPVPTPGTLRHVSIDNLVAVGTVVTSSITGLPGHNVEDVSLSNIRIVMDPEGKSDDARMARAAARAAEGGEGVPERPGEYPEAWMFGGLPSYGLYCRHVDGLTLRNFQASPMRSDKRPMLICDDISNLTLDGLEVIAAGKPRVDGDQPFLRFVNVKNALIRGCRAPLGTAAFLRVEGDGSDGICAVGNDFSGARKAFDISPGVKSEAICESANRPAKSDS